MRKTKQRLIFLLIIPSFVKVKIYEGLKYLLHYYIHTYIYSSNSVAEKCVQIDTVLNMVFHSY